MDGLPGRYVADVEHTLKAAIGCVGVGVHGGSRVALTLRPAPEGHGIVFRRSDLGVSIPARHDLVLDTRLNTTIGLHDNPAARVATVEHLMAALAGLGVDNALVELDGAELPILDGSAAGFVFLIECAGIAAQDATRRAIEVVRPVRVADGAAFAELLPGVRSGLDMELSIAFEASAIGQQTLSMRLDPHSFRAELSRARTFAMADEIEALRAAGLAQGGTLDNAVVVDGVRILNPGGLRMSDEFVRHKMLDAVGDLSLAGAPIRGRFVGHRSGHGLNNRLVRTLLADAESWRWAEAAVPVSLAA